MDGVIYKSKVDWWVPGVVIVTFVVCMTGSLLSGKISVIDIVIASLCIILEVVMFASVKYQICDGKVGIRNFFYRWEWFPVDKISEVKKMSSILSSAALSAKRVSIKFSDKKILKSSMPLEISPQDRDGFIAHLKEINPEIAVKG